MKLWKCECHWFWIISKKKVFGPFWYADGQFVISPGARIRKFEDWEIQNSDCARRFLHDK